MGHISEQEFLMGRDAIAPLTTELRDNMKRTLERVNGLLSAWPHPVKVSSGYRPPSINAATKGAAKHSNHMICLAVDLQDLDGSLARWCLEHAKVGGLLEGWGLWLEHPDSTPKWVHLQSIPVKSGKRVFYP